LVVVTERSIRLREIFEEIEGGAYALKHFKGEEYLGDSYRVIN
jgi:hypothetical protein